jgi:hypothetical protein
MCMSHNVSILDASGRNIVRQKKFEAFVGPTPVGMIKGGGRNLSKTIDDANSYIISANIEICDIFKNVARALCGDTVRRGEPAL